MATKQYGARPYPDAASILVVDVELVSPDRLVRSPARTVSIQSLSDLAARGLPRPTRSAADDFRRGLSLTGVRGWEQHEYRAVILHELVGARAATYEGPGA